MNINLLDLKLNKIKEINIDDIVNIDKSFYENTDIRSISDVKIKGKIIYHGEDLFELLLNIDCDLILPCSITLDDVKRHVNINISEDLSENSEENNKIINNSIDLIPIIWQNIILEVPLKVIGDNVDRSKLHGDGWRLVTDEDELQEKDTRLEKLKEFLND